MTKGFLDFHRSLSRFFLDLSTSGDTLHRSLSRFFLDLSTSGASITERIWKKDCSQAVQEKNASKRGRNCEVMPIFAGVL